MSTRDTLHRLIDELPESELTAAERFLNYLLATADPVLQALLEAPPDDEPETEEERQAVHEAREELRRELGWWVVSQFEFFAQMHQGVQKQTETLPGGELDRQLIEFMLATRIHAYVASVVTTS
jgi:hypothetical protein